MEKKELLYEGKAKKVFTTEDPEVVIVDYKDDATAFNGEKKGTIVGKGAINNRMSNHIFKMIEKEGVPTHLVEELSDRETAVKKGGNRTSRGDCPQCGCRKLFQADGSGRRQRASVPDPGIQL